MKIFEGQVVPIKSWCNNPEEGAIEQARNLAKLPFIFKHVALMPDTHQGYGMPIGGVIATKGVVIPNAVGVDIGCGMCAVKTALTHINTEGIKEIMGKIREVVPVGFNRHKESQYCDFMPACGSPELDNDYHPIINQQYDSALKQLGTLGGGNHFIEIQKGSDGHIWIMIHSGSRNLGYKVAKHYNEIAIKLNEKYFSKVEKSWELAFLPMGTQEAADYINEMNYCVEFALANRSLMMERIKEIIATQLGRIAWTSDFEIPPNVDDKESMAYGGHTVTFKSMINIAHNYARLENHFGKNVWVHRKGATSAKEGEIGIIPGSQGTKSYIVRGLGNKESFESCSHGAGRLMGRVVAKKTLDLAEQIAILDKQGIVHNIRNISDLDEAPGAYKDIDVVMKNQEDLVEIVTELTPIAVIKG